MYNFELEKRINHLKIVSGNANRELAEAIAKSLGIDVARASISKFSDGEINVNFEESVRGCDVFVVQPTCEPVNDNIMELLIMIDALKRASAARITAVIPYYGYARQDRKSRGREPITAKLVANLIQSAGATRVLTVDLHAQQIQGFFDIPVDHLVASGLIADYYKAKNLEDVVVVSPDTGGVRRARILAEQMGAPLAIIDKRRPMPNVSEVMNIIGEIEGKTVIMIDDIIDTAGTITNAATALAQRGAKDIYVSCTHAILSGPAVERIKNAPIKEVVTTNTIPQQKHIELLNLKALSVAPLIGEAIMRIYQNAPVSEMF